MDDTYRLAVQEATRRVIAGRARRRAFGWAPRVGITAAFAVVVGVLLSRHTSNVGVVLPGSTDMGDPLAVATVIAVRAPATVGRGVAIHAGDRLASEAVVRTGSGGRVTLVTRRGAEMTAASDTELVLGSLGAATLRAGQVYCTNRNHDISRIDTPAGRIRLLGTQVDASVLNATTVAVTVVEGSVQLANAQGQSVVAAGTKATLVASQAPKPGSRVDVKAATAWYAGGYGIQSDVGDIAYTVTYGDGLATEVWAVRLDGSNRRRLKTYFGYVDLTGPWLPGDNKLVLRVGSALWTTPDPATHRADTHAGHPIVENKAYLLDATTTAEAVQTVPPEYRPIYTALSPDTNRVAFCGFHYADADNRGQSDGGVWVCETSTGEYKKLLNGWIKTPVSWAPDSRRIVASTGEDYGTHHPLVIVDTETGQVTDLHVQGAGAVFSPDGTKVAYCGDFKSGGSWYRGVPMSGSIFVKDLSSDAPPVRLSPEGQGSIEPRWSPDGFRVMYEVEGRGAAASANGMTWALYVAQVDGTGTRRIHAGTGGVHASWTRAGDAVLAATRDALDVVAADGSGVIRTVRLDAGAGSLSREARAQTDAALAELREAIYRFALASVGEFEGVPTDSRANFRAVADRMTALLWKYPLAQLSADNVMAYADKASAMAAKPDAAKLAESCKVRLGYLATLLANYIQEKKAMPASLADLERQARKGRGWGIDWLSSDDAKHVGMIFQCPVAKSGQPSRFVYTPPAAGTVPRLGDVVFSCPNCRDHRAVWDGYMQFTWDRVMKAKKP